MMSMSQVDEAKKTFDEMKDKNGSKGLEVIVYPKVSQTSKLQAHALVELALLTDFRLVRLSL